MHKQRMSMNEIEELSLAHTYPDLDYEELKFLADRLLKIIYTLRTLLLGFKIRQTIEQTVAWKLLLKLYKYIIEVLLVLDREHIKTNNVDIGNFIRNLHNILMELDQIIDLNGPVTLDIEPYLIAVTRLALLTLEKARRALRKKSNIPPEIEIIIFELRKIAQVYCLDSKSMLSLFL